MIALKNLLVRREIKFPAPVLIIILLAVSGVSLIFWEEENLWQYYWQI